ncbi:M20 family metallopeptidase [Pseudomonas citronellolis]|uniref:M20 family metallopeptidase n=1 Tax=Pseudomonas citronellolis TaxID=53408 RepID=A0AAW6P7W4_9PSED|nr:M20 aminoacylase family protein [Pseudomonas citronellolis]MDF3843287.1 M20 family metallopeptidase [Pseudomonas citronellolis]
MNRACIAPGIAAIVPEMVELRRAIHAEPELGFEEYSTRERVIERLRAWGYEIAEMAGTGVIATLRNGPGPVLGLRAELDALPIHEQSGLPWSSQVPGKMHACGHDGHTAMLLAAACELARERNWRGTLHLFFQPAEEGHGGSGAKRMLDEGLLQRFPCDALFAMHNLPGLAEGRFMVMPGPCMASADDVTILIHGRGGHGAMPEQTVDPILAGAALVGALQSLVSRNVPPSEAAVLTVGAFLAGDASNVIPDSAELRLSVRALSPQVRELLLRRIHELAQQQAASFGARAEVLVAADGYPVLVNDPGCAGLVRELVLDWLGDEGLEPEPRPIHASEDFAFWLEQAPGCYLMIGNGDGEGGCAVHNPGYDFNDRILPLGATFWVRLAQRFLA